MLPRDATATLEGRQAAEVRAAVLLNRFLVPEQQEDLANQGFFRVRGSLGTIYRVGGSRLSVESDGQIWACGGTCCSGNSASLLSQYAVWVETLIYGDRHLGMKLALEADEKRVVSTACVKAPGEPWLITGLQEPAIIAKIGKRW